MSRIRARAQPTAIVLAAIELAGAVLALAAVFGSPLCGSVAHAGGDGPRAVEALLAQGRAAQTAGRFDEAEAVLRRAVAASRGAQRAMAFFLLGVNEAALKRWTSAQACFRRAFLQGGDFGAELDALPLALRTRALLWREEVRTASLLAPEGSHSWARQRKIVGIVGASLTGAAVIAGVLVGRSASAAEEDIRVSQQQGRLTNHRYQVLSAAVSLNRSVANGLLAGAAVFGLVSLRLFLTKPPAADAGFVAGIGAAGGLGVSLSGEF